MKPRLPAWTVRLTWKAAAFITVMCCALAALLGALVHVSVTHQTLNQAREKALTRLEEATRAYEAGDPLPPDTGIDPEGLPGSLRELALSGRHGTLVSEHDGRPTMWAAAPAGRRAMAAEIDYSQGVATIMGLDRAIVGSSLLAISATLLVGVFAVTRVTRRLHQTAGVARRISAGDLDARVNDPRTKDPSRPEDEVATVAGALDAMAATLQGKLQSEQRFTADVAHELRTPLTGLHAAAELLPPGRPTQLVQDRVRAMRLLTEDLLEISRLDAGSEQISPEAHRIAPLAERVARGPGRGPGVPTEVRIVRDACVETDRRRLERVLGNLIGNAHQHGREPVVLTVDGPVVTVRDHGDGFPEYLVRHGPQRFRTEPHSGGKGHGLGLTIAVGQAEAIGAELTFANAPDGGAVATLRLPEVPQDAADGASPAHPDGPAHAE
ncbi:two-component sensor histidine kinase [Streptomyces agglomeratus]|uniref:histidine kinase n=2 Tax=Streptomyces agglomeratus TaxID=285458 RepID=A0A1E5P6C9_9ACTN|nr:two-component sensor histidine kinase [Streptomyces agglomeratus]OEJ40948.1 two-component sensor histidine kinase [Streptomyces agglomeratus]OEJ44674.1 two-component sensor histidine kinase [Streptomyces agglomeratus]OEJ53483.1 two-component sensor histidine kinase [Streptomyces agglomeratus]OEJ60823.1 two-component sensor histidine kinase [Streptomyces agglomeratus]